MNTAHTIFHPSYIVKFQFTEEHNSYIARSLIRFLIW